MEARLLKFITIIASCIVIFTLPYLKSPTYTEVKSDTPVVSIPQEKIVQETPKTTILLGGDAMLGRSVTVESLDEQHNPIYPFEKILSTLNSADFVFFNLENPIVSDCPRKTEGLIFCAPPSMLQGLHFSGETIVNLANNHTKNYGEKGLSETTDYLRSENIPATGVGKLVIKNIHGVFFGFLGFDKSQQSNPTLTTQERDLIATSNTQVDVLIVAFHWGVEYNNHPTAGQRALAQEVVDLGADVIVGHHPHWTQDMDHIGSAPVFYSLGNLVFDQMWSEETKFGMLVKLTFEGKQIVNEEHIPIYIEKTGQPRLVNPDQQPSK